MTSQRKIKVGRPTKFKQEFCALLEEKMAQGFTHRSFCADVNICEDTFYAWMNQNKEFSEAHKRGKQKQFSWWEQLGRAAAAGKVQNANTGIFIWMTKNLLGFRDKHEISGVDGGPIELVMQIQKMSDEQLTLKAQEAIKFLESKNKETTHVIDVNTPTKVREPSS